MQYNKNLSQERILKLEKRKDEIFIRIGKYNIQKKYYEDKINIDLEKIEDINKQLY